MLHQMRQGLDAFFATVESLACLRRNKLYLIALARRRGQGIGSMKILAIDATLRNTACVLFDDDKLVDAWFISTKADRAKWETTSEKDQRDVADWVKGMQAVINEARPDIVCAEQSLGAAKSASALKQLSLVAGVMYTMAALADVKAPWLFTRIYAAKRAAVGKNTATKNEIINAMVKRFPDLERFVRSKKTGKWNTVAEHYADACANYLACLDLPETKLIRQRESKK